MAKKNWEEMIARRLKEGRGTGRGSAWNPWEHVQDISSNGRCHRPYIPKFDRYFHALSDGEDGTLALAERAVWSDEAYEQYPFQRELSLAAARSLGIDHPCYPGSTVPSVITVDLVVSGLRNGKRRKLACMVKVDSDIEDTRTIEKLQIQRACALEQGMQPVLVLKSQLPLVVIENITWVRAGMPKPLQEEPYTGYWEELTGNLKEYLAAISFGSTSLNAECARFAARHGVVADHAIRAAKILLYRRELDTDFWHRKLYARPMSAFTLTRSTLSQMRGAA